MELLEQRIRQDGIVKEGNVLKVDGFLNHRMDVTLLKEMAEQWHADFSDKPINKILTIEASGIGIAAIAGLVFDVPVLFAKKSKSINIDGSVYCARVHSFTHKTDSDVIVSKKFLDENDHVLIIDDFMAKGYAMQGLVDLVTAAGATLEGIGVAVEKGFQGGGDRFRASDIPYKALAVIEQADENGIIFREED